MGETAISKAPFPEPSKKDNISISEQRDKALYLDQNLSAYVIDDGRFVPTWCSISNHSSPLAALLMVGRERPGRHAGSSSLAPIPISLIVEYVMRAIIGHAHRFAQIFNQSSSIEELCVGVGREAHRHKGARARTQMYR